MTASGRTSQAELRPGTGERVRREFRLRAALALVLAAAFAAAAAYGGYGVATSGEAGVPFLVSGVAGALAQLALAAALGSARRAIGGDRYDRQSVTRARSSLSAVLVVLAAGVVVGFIAGTATLGGGLAGLLAAGLIVALALTADGWRHLRHLG